MFDSPNGPLDKGVIEEAGVAAAEGGSKDC